MATTDKILVLEFCTIMAYTAIDMWLFYQKGSEPATLTTCFFTFWGMENGVLGWIKTTKEKQTSSASAEASEDTLAGTGMEDRQEPDDVGVK